MLNTERHIPAAFIRPASRSPFRGMSLLAVPCEYNDDDVRQIYGDYNETRREGIKVKLPPLMNAFWSDGAIHFLLYVLS